MVRSHLIRRLPLALLAVVAVACSSPDKEQTMPETKPGQQTDKPAADPQTDKPAAKSAAPAVCTDLACLKANEGIQVQVRGRYLFPKQKKFAQTKVKLTDNTEVVIRATREGVFAQDNDGATVIVTGTIFTGQIPDRYKIFGRTADPHLLDVTGAETAPAK